MKTQTDKTQEQQSDTAPKIQQETGTGGTATITDNRPSTVYQRKLRETMNAHAAGKALPVQQKMKNTGLPDTLKTGVENLSGYSMDDVKVHYNSSKPAQLQAHAYAQGTDIHLAPGQERHLPHEAWHVVQQKQGRVKPTMQLKGKVNINDDAGLEKEADVMGGKALSLSGNNSGYLTLDKFHITRKDVNGITQLAASAVVQKNGKEDGDGKDKEEDKPEAERSTHDADVVEDEEFKIEGYPVGKFLGITYGGKYSTYYFEHGHLTQVHDKPENVGFHPNKKGKHYMKNIEESVHKEYGKARGEARSKNEEKSKKAEETKQRLKEEIVAGMHDAPPGEGKLFEVTEVKGGFLGHPSRGRFIAKEEDDRTEEALEALKTAKLADNEKR